MEGADNYWLQHAAFGLRVMSPGLVRPLEIGFESEVQRRGWTGGTNLRVSPMEGVDGIRNSVLVKWEVWDGKGTLGKQFIRSRCWGANTQEGERWGGDKDVEAEHPGKHNTQGTLGASGGITDVRSAGKLSTDKDGKGLVNSVFIWQHAPSIFIGMIWPETCQCGLKTKLKYI